MQRRDYNWKAGATMCALLATTAVLGACGNGDDTPNAIGRSGPDLPPGAAPPSAVAEAAAASATVDPATVAADNAFGLSLFNALVQADATNTAIAPVSIALALQIIYGGAAGTTQQAMAQTLRLTNPSARALDDANAALQAALLDPDPQVQLTIANSLWLHQSANPVLPAFTQSDQTYYGATLGDLAGAPDNVNAWVASATNGMITNILPPGDYASQASALVLASVIYFKGQWTTAFDASQTTNAPFTLTDGTQTSATMMHRTGNYAYLRGSNFQALRLPYGAGRLSMLVVLPDPTITLDSFVAGMTPDTVESWASQMQTLYGNITLPRFTTTFGVSLKASLTALGMGVAFARDEADLSGLAPGAYLADAEHKTVVEVDETGTLAAGTTAATARIGLVEATSFTMAVDHPFFYAIRDDTTGALLFVGALVNPN